ncbi:MAG: hypothetical protein ACYS76_03720 [Planctomycetota bacterium]
MDFFLAITDVILIIAYDIRRYGWPHGWALLIRRSGMVKGRAPVVGRGGTPSLRRIQPKKCIPIFVDRYPGSDIICDLSLPKGRMTIMDEKDSAGGKVTLKSTWELFKRYAFEAFIAICIFGVFLACAKAARCLNVWMAIPEFTVVFKIIELCLLVLGGLLCILFVVTLTLNFAKTLIRFLWR